MDQHEFVKEIIQANAAELYKDSAQPSIRVLGKALAQCVSLFATPIGRMAQIFEKNINLYLDKLEGLNQSEITEPDTRILVPILEKLRYIDDEKVADYYTEILATASTKEGKTRVSLSFIEILNRLTSDELRILEFIRSEKNVISTSYFSEEEKKQYKIQPEIKVVKLLGTLPVLTVKIVNKDSQLGFRILIKHFNTLHENVELLSPDNIPAYLDNLLSLGLLDRNFGERLAMTPIYKTLKENDVIKNISIGEELSLELEEGKLGLTDLCKNLLDLCHKYEK